jgi:DNA-binding NarL/FixJ family response regulator
MVKADVVVTTSEQEQDVVESYKLGATSYIVKPVNFDKFVEAVSELGFYWMLWNNPRTERSKTEVTPAAEE